MPAAFTLIMFFETEIQEGLDVRISNKNDIASRTAIPAISTGITHPEIAVVAFAALTAVSGFDLDTCGVNESHELY